MSRTVLINQRSRSRKAQRKDDGDGKPVPPGKRIPVRIDRRTVIYVAEGDDVAEHVRRYREHEAQPPNFWGLG